MEPGRETRLADRNDEAAASGGILRDIAALARQLAATEPFKSASGPDALRALAARLDALLAPPRRPEPAISVAVRPARKKPAR
jgi:hypothetical protein